jgi:hypothetical protein
MSSGDSPPQRPRARSNARYVAFVGLAFIALIVVATVNTISNPAGGLLGINAAVRGEPLPEFAVPNVRGGPQLDANVYQDDCATSANPCPADERHAPACQIQVPHAIRVCDLFTRPLVISFWFMRAADCLPTQDVFNAVAGRYRGRVNFLSIDVRDDLASVRRVVSEHHWQVPVGWDGDGAVSDLYRVGGCPTVAFAYPGGIFAGAKARVANLTRPKLTRDVENLLVQSRRRAAESN